MPYAVFPATGAPRAPERSGTLEYLFNNGGLSNQKMALAALLLASVAKGMPAALPYIHVKDQRREEEMLARYDDVFQTDPVRQFSARYGTHIDCEHPGGERGGWPFFFAFGEYVNQRAHPDVVRTLLDALASIRPRIVLTPTFSRLKEFVYASLGIQTVIQLRIEHDWQRHAQHLLPRTEGKDDIAIGFEEILRRTANTFRDLRIAYVTADEASMPAPKDDIRAFAQERFGIRLIWKSDLIGADDFNPLDLSIIDFEIARAAPRFVGLSFSTFTTLLCLEKFAAQRRRVVGHFIYNHPGDVVRERHDNGFALGSADAVQPNWSDTLWPSETAAPSA